MEVRVWGARGSYPASGARFSEFGHHTPCVAVSAGDDLVVLDAGSGAAALGEHLRDNPVRRVHLLLSHFHHDHLMGLPFLLFGAGEQAAISIHTALGSGVPLQSTIDTLFSAPFFPADPARLLGRVAFCAHPVGADFAVGDFAVRSAPLDHPGGSAAFRVSRGRTSVVYASDLEASLEPSSALVALALKTDLLIHDTMFTRQESEARRGWGHATFEAATTLARAANAGVLAGFHHNPLHDDEMLRVRERELAALSGGAFMAREGQIIQL